MIAQGLRGTDAEARLARALVANAGAAGVLVAIERSRSRPWSSATFEGVQLHVALHAAPVDATMAWLTALPDAELPMRGHVAMPPAIDSAAERDDGLVVELSVLVLIDR